MGEKLSSLLLSWGFIYMWAMVTKAVQAVSPDTASTAYFTASDHCLLVLTTVSS